MSSNLSIHTTKNRPTTCAEQAEMPNTCVLTNEFAPGLPRTKQKKNKTCVSPHGHRAERKLRQKQLGPQAMAVCYVYVFAPSSISIYRELSSNRNPVIFGSFQIGEM